MAEFDCNKSLCSMWCKVNGVVRLWVNCERIEIPSPQSNAQKTDLASFHCLLCAIFFYWELQCLQSNVSVGLADPTRRTYGENAAPSRVCKVWNWKLFWKSNPLQCCKVTIDPWPIHWKNPRTLYAESKYFRTNLVKSCRRKKQPETLRAARCSSTSPWSSITVQPRWKPALLELPSQRQVSCFDGGLCNDRLYL